MNVETIRSYYRAKGTGSRMIGRKNMAKLEKNMMSGLFKARPVRMIARRRMQRQMNNMMSQLLVLLGGAGVGAGLMYFLDPERGNARRAMVRDKAGSLVFQTTNTVGNTAQNLANHARGLFAAPASMLRRTPLSDEELSQKVKSTIGPYTSHAAAIQVTSHHGRVTLSGPILADEVKPLIERAARVPGVRAVQNNLTAYQSPDQIPGLQG